MALTCRSCERPLADRRRSWCDDACRQRRRVVPSWRDPSWLLARADEVRAALIRNADERVRLLGALRALEGLGRRRGAPDALSDR